MDTFKAVVVIIGLLYFSISLIISHMVYRHFKNRQAGVGGGLMGGLGGIVPGQGGMQMQQGGRRPYDDEVGERDDT